jgi:putative transposase
LKHEKLKEILEKILRGQSESREWEVLAIEIQPDHLHLFVSVPPSWSPSEVVNILKGNTSRQLRLVFPFLKTIIRKSLWADGYYVSTAGYVSQEQVRKYIDEQSRRLNLRFEKDLDKDTKEELDKSILDYCSIPPNPKGLGILEEFL